MIIAKSDQIFNHIIKTPEYLNSKVISIYCGKEKEVQTEKIIKYSLINGKRIIIPITIIKKKCLQFSEIKDYDNELEISTFNVLEPKNEFIRPININEIQLVIIPGIGFDKEGGRLGYGFGYYDRFLKSLKNYIPFFGLAFELQIVEILPTSKNDIFMHQIISEKGIIVCNEYK